MILTFAWRYIKGKKSTQAVQIISWISMLAMTVGTAALIIVLSVFNGFEFYIKDLYSNFYPPIKISAISGKHFSYDENMIAKMKQLTEIKNMSICLEEKILIAHEDNQIVVTLKGVDSQYTHITRLNEKMIGGEFNTTTATNFPNIILGIGVSNRLGANENTRTPINAYTFKAESNFNSINPEDAYNTQFFSVGGLYALQDDIDNKYVFCDLSWSQSLLQKNNLASSIEIDLKNPKQTASAKQQIQNLLSAYPNLKIETRYEQNKTLNFILSTERWFVFAFLTFILIIASFNIVGALSMLVIEKEHDISILKAMGMPARTIQNIFLSTGMMLALLGCTIGCGLAALICWIQMQFGVVKLGGSGAFLVEAYPVKFQLLDFVMVFLVVILISFLASIVPAIRAARSSSFKK